MPKTRIGLDSGYSQRTLARLAFSAAAAELSDSSRARVHTGSDRSAAPGEFIHDALTLVGLAESVLQQAVVLERERGTSWAEIGEALDVSKQAAQQKYGPKFEKWRSALDEPLVRGLGSIYDCRLPDGADDPDACVRRLDAWLTRHKDSNVAKRSVSGELEHATLVEQVTQLLRRATSLREYALA